MNILNFINPEQSTIQYQSMIFPDGQPHLKLDMGSIDKANLQQPLQIRTRIASSNDLLMVLFAKNSLDYLGFEHIELYISYLMAARMDRVMQDGEPFSLKVIASLLNSVGFRKIFIFDPHSEVTTAVIDRSYGITNHEYVKDALAAYFAKHQPQAYSLVSPDAGALKKIHKLAQFLGIEHVVECMKERDVKTGKLISFKTMAENLAGQTCFIIDDICDGGGTFAGTAQMLKEKGAERVVLIVTHGIFSKGTTIDFVDEIYTTDSYKSLSQPNVFSVEDYL